MNVGRPQTLGSLGLLSADLPLRSGLTLRGPTIMHGISTCEAAEASETVVLVSGCLKHFCGLCTFEALLHVLHVGMPVGHMPT